MNRCLNGLVGGLVSLLAAGGCFHLPTSANDTDLLHAVPLAEHRLDRLETGQRAMGDAILRSLLPFAARQGDDRDFRAACGDWMYDVPFLDELDSFCRHGFRERPIALRSLEAQLLANYKEGALDNGHTLEEIEIAIREMAHSEYYLLRIAAYLTPDPDDAGSYLPVILRSLFDPSPKTRALAAIGLAKLPSICPEALDDLTRRLNDPNAFVRLYAARTLYQIESRRPVALATLLDLLASDKVGVSEVAACCLAELGADTPETLTGLCAATKSADPGTRAQAIYALGHLGAAAVSTIPCLIEALEDSRNNEEVPVQPKPGFFDDNSTSDDLKQTIKSFAVIALWEVGRGDERVRLAVAKHFQETPIFSRDRAIAKLALQRISECEIHPVQP